MTAARILAEQLCPVCLLVYVGHLVLDGPAAEIQQTRWRSGNFVVPGEPEVRSDRLIQLEDLLRLKEITPESSGKFRVGIGRCLLWQTGVAETSLFDRWLLRPVSRRLVTGHLLRVLRIVHRIRRIADRQRIVLMMMVMVLIVLGCLVGRLTTGIIASLQIAADALEWRTGAGVAGLVADQWWHWCRSCWKLERI